MVRNYEYPCIVNIIAADGMGLNGARPSAAIKLTSIKMYVCVTNRTKVSINIFMCYSQDPSLLPLQRHLGLNNT